MSNRRRVKPPQDEAVEALLAATECEWCGSQKALRRWRGNGWEITPLHRESCPTRRVNGRSASPHRLSEAAVAAVREQGHRLAYMAYTDDSGGVVGGQAAGLSILSR